MQASTFLSALIGLSQVLEAEHFLSTSFCVHIVIFLLVLQRISVVALVALFFQLFSSSDLHHDAAVSRPYRIFSNSNLSLDPDRHHDPFQKLGTAPCKNCSHTLNRALDMGTFEAVEGAGVENDTGTWVQPRRVCKDIGAG